MKKIFSFLLIMMAFSLESIASEHVSEIIDGEYTTSTPRARLKRDYLTELTSCETEDKDKRDNVMEAAKILGDYLYGKGDCVNASKYYMVALNLGDDEDLTLFLTGKGIIGPYTEAKIASGLSS